jgi:zinc transport system substrate-binding protein
VISLKKCLILLGVVALAAGAAERPVVFVSISPQAWLVKRLAGESVEVQTLLSAGGNPHTFEPGARQVKKLSDATLYLTVGMPFEAALVSRASRLNPGLSVAGMDAGMAKLGGGTAHDHDAPGHVCSAEGDPHIWLSPRLFCAMASNTVTALDRVFPQWHPAFVTNLACTVAEIQESDRAVRAAVRGASVKVWAAYHPSWSYFAEDYGLTLLVIEKDGKAPPARHLAEVIGRARAAGVKVVFAEPQYDSRPAQTVAKQVGARLETLDPLQEDWPALMRELAEKLNPSDRSRLPSAGAVGYR